MKIPPISFFNFCATHSALLRAIYERRGEFSEAETLHLIHDNLGANEELPANAWRKLTELQILVPTEPGGHLYLLAGPVAGLLTHLFNDTKPATPEAIEGYVRSLDAAGKHLVRALDENDVVVVKAAFEEINQTLLRIHAGLDETHGAILREVARYKTERSQVTVREKFRRIVHWMKRYVEPMIEIVRADGAMRETFDKTERLFHRARADALHNDSSALARNLRLLRIIREHSLRVFTQCRKEIQPLYESLRRSSFIAEGAARALDKLQNDSLAKWGNEMLIGICSLQIKNVPGDAAIARALRRVIDHPPEPAPILEFTTEDSPPAALDRRRWLDALSDDVRPELPIDDLLTWLVQRHPAKDTAHILAALSELVFDPRFQPTFTDREQHDYPTSDGSLTASPVQLVSP